MAMSIKISIKHVINYSLNLHIKNFHKIVPEHLVVSLLWCLSNLSQISILKQQNSSTLVGP